MAQVEYEACLGANYTSGGSISLEWFSGDQRRGIAAPNGQHPVHECHGTPVVAP